MVCPQLAPSTFVEAQDFSVSDHRSVRLCLPGWSKLRLGWTVKKPSPLHLTDEVRQNLQLEDRPFGMGSLIGWNGPLELKNVCLVLLQPRIALLLEGDRTCNSSGAGSPDTRAVRLMRVANGSLPA